MKVWITKDRDRNYEMWQYDEMPYKTIHGYWQTYGADNRIVLSDEDVYELIKELGYNIPNDEAVEFNLKMTKS